MRFTIENLMQTCSQPIIRTADGRERQRDCVPRNRRSRKGPPRKKGRRGCAGQSNREVAENASAVFFLSYSVDINLTAYAILVECGKYTWVSTGTHMMRSDRAATNVYGTQDDCAIDPEAFLGNACPQVWRAAYIVHCGVPANLKASS